MAEKDISGADISADFGHWHGALYDVLALLEGASALSAEEHGSGNSVARLINEARFQLDKAIDGFDAWQLNQ